MAKSFKVYWSPHGDNPEYFRTFRSEAKTYEFVDELRQIRARRSIGIADVARVFEHDGTRWCLYERVDLTREA